MVSGVLERFLKYISFDTQSKPDVAAIPSTEKQRDLAEFLAEELKSLGAQHVRVDENSYVYASIPATDGKDTPALGFIAHMDTSFDYPGGGVKPQIIKDYDGSDILLNGENGLSLSPAEFPDLLDYKGQDLITTDGSTLLGADDKAGIAEILTMADYFLSNPQIPHGPVQIAFTPDEEVGRGTDCFDISVFGADIAYTVDGGKIGELEYENFNAASGKVHIRGSNIHPGSAKGKMKNAILIGMEFQSLLPAFENPMYTEGYEGFYHLNDIHGDVEEAHLNYIIRDHDKTKFSQKKELFLKAAGFLNQKYGNDTVLAEVKDNYYNMREKIEPHIYMIDLARESMEELSITPQICPIRGGTDGARLSYQGLPCPNLCTGGHNFHGKYEFICIQSMEKIVDLLIKIVENLHKMYS
ncbi:peptidase T [Clostridium sp. MCC353]|uniref:peptidase T n=1 Tax=Clostridium sp. MCC353 TaxID=2592646 RepID=UPI001C020159|nr:peptidase T [Clostridium sp. MCC353]MBT9775784.1 peptidase T [Clostridium sp. MCC353]